MHMWRSGARPPSYGWQQPVGCRRSAGSGPCKTAERSMIPRGIIVGPHCVASAIDAGGSIWSAVDAVGSIGTP